MISTIERNVKSANDTATKRLDDLETLLPAIPSKALAATRSSVRRVNDVVESAASSICHRSEAVRSDASSAVATSTDQARSAVERSSATIESGVKQTAGQARAAVDTTTAVAKRGVNETTGQARAAVDTTTAAVKRGVNETTGQARSNIQRSTTAVKAGVAETVGQVKAQAKRTVQSATDEVEGALDDAKVATDPDDLASLSKAKLYERAQKLDIEGRSAMTKAELVGALQKA